MKIYCKELDKSFDSKDELFKALINNEGLIIDAKKSQIYKSYEKGLEIVTDQKQIEKAFTDTTKGIKFDSDYYYFVVNSANFIDSHKDMHVDGNWNKSVKEQQGKNYLVFDHSLKRGDVIAMKKDVEQFTAKVAWSLLGKSYDGETYSLIYKVAKDKIINKEAKEWLEAGHEMEASVRMQYVKIDMAINSKDADYAKYKEVYDTYAPLIVNKDDFEKIDYFWVVKEAKNVMESSLVLFGSNSATGQINNNKEAVDDTSTIEPTDVTQNQEKEKSYYSHLI